jgi:hypothetical protein
MKTFCFRKLKLDPCLSPGTSNSKQIKDLNIIPEILQLVQERAGNTKEAIPRTSSVESQQLSN